VVEFGVVGYGLFVEVNLQDVVVPVEIDVAVGILPDVGLLSADIGLLSADVGLLSADVGLLLADVGLLLVDVCVLPAAGELVADEYDALFAFVIVIVVSVVGAYVPHHIAMG